MSVPWRTIIWRQFGAAIDMLENALHACPDERWQESVWDDPTDAPEYTQVWFIFYHTLAWTDRYLSGAPKDFAPPAPFIAGALPAQPYSRAQIQSYLDHCRRKCHETLEAMDDEKANQRCLFPWGEEVGFAELQLYSMRHVQEHASQLSLHLGRKGETALDWVAQAEDRSA
jgi:hypothetical protein